MFQGSDKDILNIRNNYSIKLKFKYVDKFTDKYNEERTKRLKMLLAAYN